MNQLEFGVAAVPCNISMFVIVLSYQKKKASEEVFHESEMEATVSAVVSKLNGVSIMPIMR
jgi:hypothetical protein